MFCISRLNGRMELLRTGSVERFSLNKRTMLSGRAEVEACVCTLQSEYGHTWTRWIDPLRVEPTE